MIIRSKRHWTDIVEGPKHDGYNRRDFLLRGLAAGTISVALPKLFGQDLIRAAEAATLNCPSTAPNPGAIVQIFANGGPAMGARFIPESLASGLTATGATNYGITGGANLLTIAPGMVIDTTSPFGIALMQGPPGFAGGPSMWQSKVLKNICAGGHMGPFNLDDGAGVNSGLWGSVSLDQSSTLGKDLWFNPSPAPAVWAVGTPTARVLGGEATPAQVEAPFNFSPAVAGNTSVPEITNAANGAVSISQAFSPLFGTTTRVASDKLKNSVGCAFLGNIPLADPSLATNYFDPTTIAKLTAITTVASLTPYEQSQIAAYYQAAYGNVGGIIINTGGRDYHAANDTPAIVAAADVEDARSIVMFLAACYAANAPGALIYTSNGFCLSNGTNPVPVTINGQSFTANTPKSVGDAGGFFNQGMVIFYSPSGNLPGVQTTGNPGTKMDGSVSADPKIGSQANAFAGLFLSAHHFVKGSIPARLTAALNKAAIAPNQSQVMVLK